MADYIEKIRAGFKELTVEKDLKKTALCNIEEWLEKEEFIPYREQIHYLADKENFDELLDCFYQVISFGTGGRRGTVGIGTNRINPWTIAASAQGHSEYLLKEYKKNAKERGVVLAYDVRIYTDSKKIYNNEKPNPVMGMTSKDLAIEAVKVYAANGIKVYLFDDIRTTPELSFAIRHLNAVSGDMFSASHNPKTDNGKKVYEHNGGQLIPPDDQELVNIVKNVTDIKRMCYKKACDDGLIVSIGCEVDKAYLKETTSRTLTNERDVTVVYSPLHGVGGTSVYKTLKRVGFNVIYDEKTKTPDGNFPNIKYNIPNPEVEESFETLYESGAAVNADVLISSDPDADRLGICVKTDTEYRYLNGNEIGVVLVKFILSELSSQNKLPKNPVVVETLVSTELFSKIAEEYGCKIINDLLVGFKYIAAEILKLEDKGRSERFVFGFEESHGYLAGTYARDKDAAVPAVLLCELAAKLKKEEKTIVDYLDDIYKEYGYHKSHLANIILRGAEGKGKIDQIQAELRKNHPSEIAGFKVEEFIDKKEETETEAETDITAHNVLIFKLKSDKNPMKITIRPSGTEPKTKVYFEVGGKPLGLDATDEELEKQKKDIDELVKKLEKDMILNRCYPIIGIELDERSLVLNPLLPVDIKIKYFEIEKEIIELKSQVESGTMKKCEAKKYLCEMLSIFGADPVEKITKAFEMKTGVSLNEFLKFLK